MRPWEVRTFRMWRGTGHVARLLLPAPWLRSGAFTNPGMWTMAAALVDRVRGEFNEMPGLNLTMEQAAKLWGMDLTACRQVIDALVESSFLRWTSSGRIVRAES